MTDQSRPAAQSPSLVDEELRAVIDGGVGFAVFDLDADGLITSWNTGAERVLGYRSALILGQNFALIYPTSDIAAGVPPGCAEGGGLRRGG